MTPVLSGLLALVGVLAGVLGKYLIDKRRSSGSVGTSSAAVIFQEGQEFRRDLMSSNTAALLQAENLRKEIARLNDQISKLLGELAHTGEELARSREETFQSRLEIAKLRVAVEAVHEQVTTGNAQSIAQLADNQESRRIADIPMEDRTPMERGHIDLLGTEQGSHSD